MAKGGFYDWIEDNVRQSRAVREPWLDWWDIARPSDGPVTVAMPWRTMTPGAMQRIGRDALFALPGSQRVSWIGLDPERGLVHASASWDPSAEPRPLPPATGWTPCDDAFFLAEAAFGPDRATMEPGHRYVSLPMPRRAMREGGSTDAVCSGLREVENVPLDRFLREAGLPYGVMKSTMASFLEGTPIQRAELPRFPAVMKAVLWVCGNDPAEGVPPAVARQRRRQAIEAMPCFAHLVMKPGATRQVVDPARRLVPWLADRLGLGEGTIRALGAASVRAMAAGRPVVQYGPDERHLLTLLDGVPGTLLPTLLEETSPRVFRGVAAMAKSCSLAGMPPATLRFLGHGLRPGDDRWEWLSEASRWNHLHDVAGEFARDLLWPAETLASDPEHPPGMHDPRGERRAVAAMLLASLGPSRLAAAIDAHMAGALRRAAGTGAGDGDDLRWPALSAPSTSVSGHVLRFLTSSRELAYEGEAMGHCVGDYAEDCRDGRCAILSIGRWGGDDGHGVAWLPSSTVEIVRDHEGGLEIAQHYGRGNGNPSGVDADVLADWMDAVARGDVPLDDAALADASRMSSIEHALGGAWATPEAFAARWDRWRRLLDVRQRSAGDFVRHAVAVSVPPDDPCVRAEECRALAALVVAQDAGTLGLIARDAALPGADVLEPSGTPCHGGRP